MFFIVIISAWINLLFCYSFCLSIENIPVEKLFFPLKMKRGCWKWEVNLFTLKI